MHEAAVARGAVFEDGGQWKRAPASRGRARHARRGRARVPGGARGAAASSTPRRSARSRSTGPDAAEFLDRFYVNNFAGLAVGRAATGSCCARTASSSTTAPSRASRRPFPRHDDHRRRRARARDARGMAAVRMAGPRGLAHLDDRAVGRDRRAGPLARQLLEPLVARHRLRGRAMPHMSVREGRSPASGDAVPRQLLRRARLRDQRAGRSRRRGLGSGLRGRRADGVTPYGIETVHVLRAEKGYITSARKPTARRRPTDAGLAGPSAARSRISSASARSSAPRCSRRTASSSWAC